MPPLSEDHRTRIVNTFGNKGRVWLNELPQLIQYCEQHFHLKIIRLFPNQSVNIVAHARHANGDLIVVKLCVPTNEVSNEINALTTLQGDGIVHLINSDANKPQFGV